MAMRSDIKEKNESTKKASTIKRHFDFPSDIYMAVDDHLGNENKRKGLISGKEKQYLNDIIPELVADGLKFRNGKVYVPADKERAFMKNDKFLKLRAKAELAIEEFHKFQIELMA